MISIQNVSWQYIHTFLRKALYTEINRTFYREGKMFTQNIIQGKGKAFMT